MLIKLLSLVYLAVLTSAQKPAHYGVTSILQEPYLMEKEKKEAFTGNDVYEGFCKDLADKLAERLNFTYTLTIVRDAKFGQEKPQKDGTWDGMIGEVQNGLTAQIGIAPITITHARMKVVSFSSPFLEFQLGILMKKAEDTDDDDSHGQFIFLRPMSALLWIVFLIAVGITLAALFFIERLISNKIYEAKSAAAVANELPPIPPPKPIGLCRNGVAGGPRSATGRFIQIIFWIFIVIFLAAYIATFAADRVVDRLDEDNDGPDAEIKSIGDLLAQETIKMGTLRGGSSYHYLKNSKDRAYRRIEPLINKADGFTWTTKEGVARVRNGNVTYVFIMEAPTALHLSSEKPCDLLLAEEQFGPKKGYGVITHKDMEITRKINIAILEMKENEELQALQEKWFEKRNECDDDDDDDDENGDDDDDDDDDEAEDHDPLCLSDMAGVFYLLILFIILALVLGFLEIRHYTQPKLGARDVPMRSQT
jgi:ABC-type amino acid transport substrate-binding protein